ncbi:MAG: GNAT family N-acetyltransferase [Ilumatobacteraceae bacterium]
MGAFLPFRTDRLELRPFTAADAEVFAAYRSDPDVARYQGWDAPFPLEAAHRFVATQSAIDGPVPGDWVQVAVTLDGRLVGDVAVGLDDDGLVATIGYSLATADQGRGLAREAVAAVVDRLFEDLGVHRVEATLDPANIASARLVEDLGFEYEGTARSAVRSGGSWTDDARYGLTVDSRAAWSSRPRHRPEHVHLVEIDEHNGRGVLRLATHHTQERFVAPMAVSFVDAMFPGEDGGEAIVPWFRAVEADDELAGFVMLAEPTAATPEPYLWRLLIDRRHQRRGIGDRVLTRLVDRLRAEGHQSLLVSWTPGPGGPEPFYLARGFVPTGVIDDGEIEARLAL